MSILENGGAGAVLFDLDGTLVDTAPDMVAVLQELQESRGANPIDYRDGRRYVSNGAIGLLKAGFPDIEHEFGSDLHLEFLERYEERICDASTVFADLPGLLDAMDAARCPWGVVTNKPAHLTAPLLEALALTARVACVVSGDTLPQRKPDPAPLLHACDLAGIDPTSTIYVGDALRDIEAGQNAGMATIAVQYGYITPGDDAIHWGADIVADDTVELTRIVRKAVNLGS